MGGDLRVYCEVGRGSTFTLTFPAAGVASPPEARPAAVDDAAPAGVASSAPLRPDLTALTA